MIPVPSDTDELQIHDHGEHAKVRYLTLNRPQSKNGLTIEILGALIKALNDAEANEAVRTVVLTGKGESFCSGLDLKAAMAMVMGGGLSGEELVRANEERMRNYFHRVIRTLQSLSKPVLALVDGAAAGFGCDLALACDLRIGTPRARFGEIFIKRGLMPDGGATFILPRIVGLGRAFELMLLGDIVEAEEALRVGLLNRIVHTPDEAQIYAARLGAGPPLVMREIKQAVYRSLSSTFDEALEGEVRGQLRLLASEDFAEGVSAFLMKRAPQFNGK